MYNPSAYPQPGFPPQGGYFGAPQGGYYGAPPGGYGSGYGGYGHNVANTIVGHTLGSILSRLPIWNRHNYNYGTPYSRNGPFMAPAGVSPHVGSLMQQASQLFRQIDTNYSGHVNKREFKRALQVLGISFGRREARQLFHIADTNHSGRLSEREFVEFWVWYNSQINPQMYPTIW